jgi:superfamily II DNA or RNA helicase
VSGLLASLARMNTHPELAALVGANSYFRGLEYARSGWARVESTDTFADPGPAGTRRHLLTGAVHGSRADDYWVTVEYTTDEDGLFGEFAGSCNCPVAVDCKHAVALLLTAENDQVAVAQPWEQRLRAMLPTGDPESDPLPAAIGIELIQASARVWAGRRTVLPAQLKLRPLRAGRRGWVPLGSRWMALDSSSAGRAMRPEHRELLLALARVCGLPERGPGQEWIDLTRSGGALVWDLLDSAVRIGMEVVDWAEPEIGVRLPSATAPAHALVELVDVDAGDVQLRPRLQFGDVPAPEEFSVIGRPPHAVALHGDDGVLELHRFSVPPERVWTSLTEGGPLVLPAAELPRFSSQYLPDLPVGRLRAIGAAAEFTEVGLPTLVLAVALAGEQSVRLRWRYDYPAGRSWVLGSHRGAALRDLVAEDKLADAVRSVLHGHGLSGPADGVLTGLPALVLVSRVLPQLVELPDVGVERAADLPAWTEVPDGPEVVLEMRGQEPGGPGGTDWFNMDVLVRLDGVPVPFDRLFRALAAGQEVLALPGGAWTSLNRPELLTLRTLIDEARALQDGVFADADSVRISRYQLSMFSELEELGVLDLAGREWTQRLRDLTDPDTDLDADPPDGLTAVLRPYQLHGYRWLDRLRRNGFGGVLADDMGLGKTVQMLAAIARARQDEPASGPWLVVAPTSVVPNWLAEAERFVPGLRAVGITRSGGDLTALTAGADIVVTSYTLLRMDAEGYAGLAPAALVLDEAQAVKNHRSKGFQVARRLPVPIKIAITGTPMENDLAELWAIFTLVAPGLLGSANRFAELYRAPIERSVTGDGRAQAMARLRRRIAPLLLRRTKERVATDLPAKTEQVLRFDLEPGHRRIYQRHLQRERQKVMKLLTRADGRHRQKFVILRSLTVLRQLAIDPSLSADTADELAGPEGRDVGSTKLTVLRELLDDIVGEGHRVLVFSQFTRFLTRIRHQLDESGVGYCYLDGATTHREKVVAEFKNGTAPVFLISLKAGGVGLNLAEADYCIVVDPWWNPAAEQQAVDRAHRIGQTKPVFVYRLVARDTIEEKVLALQQRKAEMIAGLLDDASLGTGTLTDDDIRELLA